MTIVIVLGVGQLVLPAWATHVVRDRLSRHGRVLSVHVSAWPAVELLFGHADSVRASMADYTASASQVATNLGQTAGVTNLDLTIGEVRSGLVAADRVTVTKHGATLGAGGVVTEANLRAAVPLLTSVAPIASAAGSVTLEGSAEVPFIGQVTADARLSAVDGRVELSGAGLVTSLLHVTVWSNPRVDVESIAGRSVPGGLELTARARLR